MNENNNIGYESGSDNDEHIEMLYRGYYSGGEEEEEEEDTSGDGYDDDPVMDVSGKVLREEREDGENRYEEMEDNTPQRQDEDDGRDEEREIPTTITLSKPPTRKTQCTHIMAGGPNKGKRCTVNVKQDVSDNSPPICSKHKKGRKRKRKETPTPSSSRNESQQPPPPKKSKNSKGEKTAAFEVTPEMINGVPDFVCGGLNAMGVKTGTLNKYMKLSMSKSVIKNAVESRVVSYAAERPGSTFIIGALACLSYDNVGAVIQRRGTQRSSSNNNQ